MGEIEKALDGTAGMIKDNLPKIKLPEIEIKDPFVEKFRKWALIILACLVGGGALILIIKSIITKVL